MYFTKQLQGLWGGGGERGEHYMAFICVKRIDLIYFQAQ